MRTPRPYQTALVEAARAKLREIQQRLDAKGIKRKPRLMIQLGCGGGKTYTSAIITQGVVEKGGRVVFLSHRDFLMDQTSKTYDDARIPHSYLAAGKWFNPWVPVHLGMIGSMKSRMGKIKPPNVCFVDEGHHGVATTWRAIVEAWPETTFLFLSATPSHRRDGKGLHEVCDDIVCGPSNADLIRMGALSDFIYYTPSSPDLSGVHTSMGEYVTSELDEEMSKAKIIGNIVETYKQKANGTKAIYFAVSIETSKKYAEAFCAAGIPARHVDADTPPFERTKVARDIATGKVLVMTNCMIATEGYDIAAQAGMDVTIETVGLCRPTQSLPLLIQMMMRSMRAKPYPAIILDHAGSYKQHNFLPDDEIEWTLAGSERPTPPAQKNCDGCGAVLKRQTWVCHACGTDNTPDADERSAGKGGREEIEHIDGELHAVDREALRHNKKLEEWQAGSIEDLISLGRRRGYNNPEAWAALLWSAREKRKPSAAAKKQQFDFHAKLMMEKFG